MVWVASGTDQLFETFDRSRSAGQNIDDAQALTKNFVQTWLQKAILYRKRIDEHHRKVYAEYALLAGIIAESIHNTLNLDDLAHRDDLTHLYLMELVLSIKVIHKSMY